MDLLISSSGKAFLGCPTNLSWLWFERFTIWNLIRTWLLNSLSHVDKKSAYNMAESIIPYLNCISWEFARRIPSKASPSSKIFKTWIWSFWICSITLLYKSHIRFLNISGLYAFKIFPYKSLISNSTPKWASEIVRRYSLFICTGGMYPGTFNGCNWLTAFTICSAISSSLEYSRIHLLNSCFSVCNLIRSFFKAISSENRPNWIEEDGNKSHPASIYSKSNLDPLRIVSRCSGSLPWLERKSATSCHSIDVSICFFLIRSSCSLRNSLLSI